MDLAPSIDVVLVGRRDLVDIFCSAEQGGRATVGLSDRLADRMPDRSARVVHRNVEAFSSIATEVDELDLSPGAVVVLSLTSALDEAAAETDPEQWFMDIATDIVASIKSRGAHVVVVNGSTFDPTDQTHTYTDEEPTAVLVHRLDCVLIELSVLDGVSVIDADRIVAEHGGLQVVEHLLSYVAPVPDAICAHFLDVLGDYRFFDPGPLVPQTGRRGA